MNTISLAALVLAVLAAQDAAAQDEARLARDAASWLSARAAELRDSPAEGSETRARALLREARDRVVAEGLSEDLARALVPDPPAGPSSEGEQADGPTERERRAARALRAIETTRRRLIAFASAAERPPPTAHSGARPRLVEILEDPVFAVRPAAATVWDRVLRAVRRLASRSLSAAAGLFAKHWRLVAIGVVLVVAATAALWIRRLQAPAARHHGPLEATSLVESAEQDTNVAPLISRAIAEMDAGRPKSALKLLLLAVVTSLKLRGDLPETPGLTDLEGVRLLRHGAAPDVHTAFQRLAVLHDRVVYARGAIDGPSLVEAIRLARTIVGDRRAEGVA